MRASDTGATSARGMMSDDALGITIGLVVEPGEYLPAPVADAAADAEAARSGAEVAPIAQVAIGTRTTSATSCMVSSSSSTRVVSGLAARWVLLMGSSWRVAGCGSRLSGGCRSFSIRTVDRSLWSMVRTRHHRLRTPPAVSLGYVVFAQVRDIPQSCPDLLSEPSLTEMS